MKLPPECELYGTPVERAEHAVIEAARAFAVMLTDLKRVQPGWRPMKLTENLCDAVEALEREEGEE